MAHRAWIINKTCMGDRRTRLIFLFGISGFLFLLDQYIKYFFFHHANTSFLYTRWLGWQYFQNSGIAFSVPFSRLFLLLFTPLVLCWLLYALVRYKYVGFFLIFIGALSNFVDRAWHGFTIDYFRIFTSIINMSDVLIVVGAVMVVWGEMKRRCVVGEGKSD